MSVLVEAVSLVIPRKVLDISYPGATDAFLEKMQTAPSPCRWVCADDVLVSVSFFGVSEARVVYDELADHGIVGIDHDWFVELVCIDQKHGPTKPCDWIEWEMHQEGYTSCWMAHRDPGPLSAPPGWTPQRSRDLTFCDFRSEPGRCLQLAKELDGSEVWLDFKTGEIASVDPYVPEGAADGDQQETLFTTSMDDGTLMPTNELKAENGALLSTVRALLDAREFKYQLGEEQTLTMTVTSEHGFYYFYFTTNDETDLVGCAATYGSKIPDDRRVAVAEALSRINLLLWLGNFELDFSDGFLRFRIGIDVEDGRLSERMVSNLLNATLAAMGRYHVALMRIAFGEVEPVIALAEAV